MPKRQSISRTKSRPPPTPAAAARRFLEARAEGVQRLMRTGLPYDVAVDFSPAQSASWLRAAKRLEEHG